MVGSPPGAATATARALLPWSRAGFGAAARGTGCAARCGSGRAGGAFLLTLGFGNAFLAAAGLTAFTAGLAGLRTAACLPDEGFVFAADFPAGRAAAFFANFFDCLMGVALLTCFGFDLAALATVFFAPRFAEDFDLGFDLVFAMSVAIRSVMWRSRVIA